MTAASDALRAGDNTEDDMSADGSVSAKGGVSAEADALDIVNVTQCSRFPFSNDRKKQYE